MGGRIPRRMDCSPIDIEQVCAYEQASRGIAASSSAFVGARPALAPALAHRGGSRVAVEMRGAKLPDGRKLRVAVVGGGPAGACTAEMLAKAGIETYLIERKMDNCKPCGGAIPLCMIEEFDLPDEIVDRKV